MPYSRIVEYSNRIQSGLDDLVEYAESLEQEITEANQTIKDQEKTIEELEGKAQI